MQIPLKLREARSLDLSPGDRLRLTTRSGTAWVTLEGTPDDHVLASSSPVNLTGPGRVVLEPLESDMIIRAELLELPVREKALLATG